MRRQGNVYGSSLLFFFLASTIYLSSCVNHQPENKIRVNSDSAKQALIDDNKTIVINQSHDIDDYINRHHLTMKVTGTGLRYNITNENKDGKSPHSRDTVKILYTIGMIDGTILYDKDSIGQRRFILGHAELPRGMEEGLMLMKEGEKALMIVPSHLGYGVSGDGDAVPHDAVLVINITLLGVND